MTRLPLALLWLAASACTVGSPIASQIADAELGDAAPDASNGCFFKNPAPNPIHTHTAPVNAANPSNAGEACVVSGCHLQGATGTNAPVWQFAGTIYHSDGVTPYPGVNVKLVGADGAVVHKSTDQGGNFGFDINALTMPFPGQSFVTACPDPPTGMVAALSATIPVGGAAGNNCNGCHVPGGVAPQSGRITFAP